MSEPVWVKNSAYGRYEELLIKKDQYDREAESILLSYTQEFGELQVDIFSERIECIRLKKMIHCCQAAINCGKQIDFPVIKNQLTHEMALYQAELESMLSQNQRASEAKTVSIEDIERVKKVYRRLAKKLHPDINPKTTEIPELMDLWNRIVLAYKNLNPKEITELEVMARHAIEKLGVGTIAVDIPDIEDRIRNWRMRSMRFSHPGLISTFTCLRTQKRERNIEKHFGKNCLR